MVQFWSTTLKTIDDLVWGVPLIVLILATGIYLTVRLKGMQIRKLPMALRYMIQNEEEGSGEVTSFGALCTAMSATIGTGNIVGVATAIAAGGPGALFWMWIAALFGMATKYAFNQGLPLPAWVSSFLLMICLIFFAFTTIIGWNYYGERCLEYLSEGSGHAVITYRFLYILAIFIGPFMTVEAVWTIADIFNALMAIPNLIAVLALSSVVAAETADYWKRMKK